MNLVSLTQRLLVAMLVAMFAVVPVVLEGKTKDGDKTDEVADPEKGQGEAELQRVPNGAFENLRNKVSNIEFFSSNFGIFGLNIAISRAGGFWPRGSGNRYIFGGGIWFGGLRQQDDGSFKKMSVISYNPNSGASWMVPGEVTQPYNQSRMDESPEGINKYRMYFSTDYSPQTGKPFDALDSANGGPNWPIWDADPNREFYVDRYLGYYISDVTKRNRDTYPKGPSIVSGEDIFTIFKDTDLNRYEIGKGNATEEGYPMGLEVQHYVYSWGFAPYKDFIFLRYDIINKSDRIYYDCFMAPALDIDIDNYQNDRNAIAIPVKADDSLNLAIQWSDAEPRPFGYVGCDFLESPAVDADRFIRKDTTFYSQEDQLGLHTFRNWIIDIDPKTPEERYDFMASGNRDVDNGPGDKRFLMSTGPFNIRPGDTARVVVGLLLAPGKNPNPTGLWDDLDSLIKLDLFAQKVYDQNFLAPKPPDPANVSWRPLDNGVELTWDEQSEISLDNAERGADFAGYIIQRARKPAFRAQVTQYDSVVGWNIGYKTIGRIDMPPLPSDLERAAAVITGNLAFLGPWWRLPMLQDFDARAGLNRGPFSGQPYPFDTISKFCRDTLKRPGLADSIIVSSRYCGRDTIFHFTFDPYDDENNDSNLFVGTRWAEAPWGDRFLNKAIRDIVRQAITEVMDSVTNNRTFIDIGDDDQNGEISTDAINLAANEKLINNVDYFYQVLAFDQGDPISRTPPKINSGIEGVNEILASPEAPPAGIPITPEIITDSTDGLAGVYNFRMVVYDDERLGQLFGGDTLEFEFQPYQLYDPDRGRLNLPMWYASEMIVRSRRTGNEINRFVVTYDTRAFRFSDHGDSANRNLTEPFITQHIPVPLPESEWDTIPDPDGGRPTIVTNDTVFYDARAVRSTYTGSFITEPGILLLGTNGVYKGTFGIEFDYAIQQFGDSLRFGKFIADSASLPPHGTVVDPFEVSSAGGDAPNTNLVGALQTLGTVPRTPEGGFDQQKPILPSTSIGQARLEVEFLPGGTEDVRFGHSNGDTCTATLNYLNVRVRNIASFARETRNDNGEIVEVPVQYDYEFPADDLLRAKLDTAQEVLLANEQSVARLVDVGEYGILAYGWTNVEGMTEKDREAPLRRVTPFVGPTPIGTPNRYYTGVANTQCATSMPLRFTHRLIANGAVTLLDFAGMGSADINPPLDKGLIPPNQPTSDFEAGDKVVINFTGGTLGLPEPGARILVAIPDPTPGEGQFTDDLLDAVHIVPNPYMISHIGQNSSGDREVYFTRLPERCTIEIFTAAGELLQTIEHDAAQDPSGRRAVNVWRLITKGGRQAQSQLLVARITTPDGAETTKKFSIVIGR